MIVRFQELLPVKATVAHVAWPRVYAASDHELFAIDAANQCVLWSAPDEITDHPEPYRNSRYTFIDDQNRIWVNEHYNLIVRMSNFKRGVVLRAYDLSSGERRWERALDEHPRKGSRINGLAASLIHDGDALRVAFSNYFAEANHMTIVHRLDPLTGEVTCRHVIDEWAFLAGMHDDHQFVVGYHELVRIDNWDEPFTTTVFFESRQALHFVPSFWQNNVVVSWHDARGRVGVSAFTKGGELVIESAWKRPGVKTTQLSVSRDEIILHVNAQTFLRLNERLEPMWEAKATHNVGCFMAPRQGPLIVGHHFQVFDRETGELLKTERASTPFGRGDEQWVGDSELMLFRFGQDWRIADARAGLIHEKSLPKGRWQAGPTSTIVGSVDEGILFAEVSNSGSEHSCGTDELKAL